MLLFVQMVVNFVYALARLWQWFMEFAGCLAVDGRGRLLPLFLVCPFLLVTVSIYSLGMLVASVAGNIKTANLLCTVLLFSDADFSGATLPYGYAPGSAACGGSLCHDTGDDS